MGRECGHTRCPSSAPIHRTVRPKTATENPYALATLVDDLRLVMEQLKISKTSLVGWSTGGNEITEFATKHPERVERLVYLEGAYDWGNEAFMKEYDRRFSQGHCVIAEALERIVRNSDHCICCRLPALSAPPIC